MLAEGLGVGREEDSQDPLRSSPAMEDAGVRWLTYAPTEVRRVLAYRTRHGCLNRTARRKVAIPRAEVGRLAAESLRLISAESTVTSAFDLKTAREKVRRAEWDMRDSGTQRAERKERKRGRIRRELWCTMWRGAVQVAAGGSGEDGIRGSASDAESDEAGPIYTQSVRDNAVELLQRGARMEGGKSRVRLAYLLSEVGRDLLEAGHQTGSREYSTQADPFRWPRELRASVFAGMGLEADDSSAYTRARMAMVPAGREVCRLLLEHKVEIMAKGGEYLYPGADSGAAERAMKGVINGFDMDSSLDAWRKRAAKVGGDVNATPTTLKGFVIQLKSGRAFSLEAYRKANAGGTAWMAGRSARMLGMIQDIAGADPERRRKARLTVKSYILQEAEAAAREAKMG